MRWSAAKHPPWQVAWPLLVLLRWSLCELHLWGTTWNMKRHSKQAVDYDDVGQGLTVSCPLTAPHQQLGFNDNAGGASWHLLKLSICIYAFTSPKICTFLAYRTALNISKSLTWPALNNSCAWDLAFITESMSRATEMSPMFWSQTSACSSELGPCLRSN